MTYFPFNVQVTCEDGSISVTVSTLNGCGEIKEQGYCVGIENPGPITTVVEQIDCDGQYDTGHSYVLSTGSQDGGSCYQNGQYWTCVEDLAMATVSCTSGCVEQETNPPGCCCDLDADPHCELDEDCDDS